MSDKIKLVTWANVVVIAIFIVLIFSQANKKFVLDEVDFPVLAHAISETGEPYHYRGESDPSSLGLWHPPLYAYSLGSFVKVFGFNENTVRAFGMLCTLFTAFLTIRIYQELFQLRGVEVYRFTLLFLSLFLLHPYTIANTTVPDIDTTILPISILSFIYGLVLLQSEKEGKVQSIWQVRPVLTLSVLFALNLWAKMTTPLVLVPFAFLMMLVKGWDFRRSAVASFSFAAIGGMIFISTYAFYCSILSLPFDFVFQFLASSFTKNSDSGGGISALLIGIFKHLLYTKQYVNWFGMTFVFALTISCSSLLLQRSKLESEKLLLALAGFSLFVMVFYLSLTGPFGGFFKYPYPVFSILMMLIAHYIQRHLFMHQNEYDFIKITLKEKEVRVGHKQILWIIFGCSAVAMSYYQLVVVRDIVIFQDQPVPLPLIFMAIGAAAITSLLFAKRSGSLWLTYGMSILLALMIGSQFGISRSQAVAPYPTKYHYGQTGFEEAISYLKERLETKEPIWSMKDVGHYANGTFLENYSSIFKSEQEISRDLLVAIKEKKVRYFVVTTGIGQDRVDAYSEFKSALDACCIVEKQFGNFLIYKTTF